MRKPKAPSGLGPEARRLWRRVAEEFELDGHHCDVLEAAARALDRAEAARRQIEAEGMTVEDRFKQAKAHPLLQVERDSRALMLRALKDLGLDVEAPAGAGRSFK